MIFSKSKNQSGQGLLELVVAIGVISVGLFSVWNLFISNFNGEQEAGARILGINLAREGVEIVKNIRDSNWLYIDNNDPCSYNGTAYEPCNWDSGLDGDGQGVIKNIFSETVFIDYSSDSLTDNQTKIYQDPDSSLYSHDISNNPTNYRRLMNLKNICCDDTDTDLNCDNFSVDFRVGESACLASELKVGIDVTATVSWLVNGKSRQTSVHERIFNWK